MQIERAFVGYFLGGLFSATRCNLGLRLNNANLTKFTDCDALYQDLKRYVKLVNRPSTDPADLEGRQSSENISKFFSHITTVITKLIEDTKTSALNCQIIRKKSALLLRKAR